MGGAVVGGWCCDVCDLTMYCFRIKSFKAPYGEGNDK
jgi:hypothetical protein